jgi:hypothetical protein
MAEDKKGIFISYRRGDTTAYAGWLADRLGNHFGEQNIFRDIGSVEPGVDFVEAIERALEASDVMLVVIGSSWGSKLIETSKTGREDYTRLEVATALKRNIWVVPVLVQGAAMPRADELPDDLAALARRNALELHDTNWQSDTQHLITVLERRRQEEITERFTQGIDQLGSNSPEIRLGGIHALEQIAKESDEHYWPVMERLTAYIRQNAPLKPGDKQQGDVPRLGLDIQTVLSVIARRTRSYEHGESEPLDLSKTHLSGADLSRVNLEGANLSLADLSSANFAGAHLSNADLSNADLSNADLSNADLSNADLSNADLSNADLSQATLEGATLEGANLSRADLREADLFKVSLFTADLSKADLTGAGLEGAFLADADVTDANLTDTHLNQEELKETVGNENTRLPADVTAPEHWEW